MDVPLCKANITEAEKDLVMKVLESGYLSGGPMLEDFEKRIANFIGVPYAIGVNSGTSAIHLALKSLGIGQGDEVILPAFSFIASANPVLMEGAKPVFVDVSPESYLMDVSKIEGLVNERTRAILPVDLLGHAADMDEINSIAGKYSLNVIEDSCEALGSEYKGCKIGNKADISTFAFFPNKQITTGEGGVILTNDRIIADTCRAMRNHGKKITERSQNYAFVGYNYKLPEMSAAMGVAQISRIENILKEKQEVGKMYEEKLNGIDEIVLPKDPPFSKKSWFTQMIYLKGMPSKDMREQLEQRGIQSRDYFSSLHLQPQYRNFGYSKGDFPITEDLTEHHLGLPFYHDMKECEIDHVVTSLKESIKKNKNSIYLDKLECPTQMNGKKIGELQR